MKRALYSIDDEEFMTLLERTDDVLMTRKIPYMFVGGVATQAHIANYLCQKEKGTSIHDLAYSSDFRIQDHLRATDDVDITLDPRGISEDPSDTKVSQEIMSALNQIEGDGVYASPTEEHLVSIKLERSGKKRPIFRLGLDKDADSPDSEVSFNLYYGPQDTNNRWPSEMVEFERQNYFDFFNTARRLSIPFSKGRNVGFFVKGIEQLVATKIARAREKDWGDLLLLYRHAHESGNPIDLEEIRRLLSIRDSQCRAYTETLLDRLDKFKFLIR